LGPWWTGGDADKRRDDASPVLDARGHWCSLAAAGEDEEDKPEPVRGSSEHEWWGRGGTMVVARARWKSRGEHERGEKVRWWLGVLGGLYWGRGRARKVAMGDNR
jgi:hypothetical protein